MFEAILIERIIKSLGVVEYFCSEELKASWREE